MENISKSIVFISGTFIGNNCWDEWIVYFESRGYTCLAPAWPFKNDTAEELRNRHPDAGIASNGLDHLTTYFAGIVGDLPVKPVLIGHSLGGLIVQLLLQKGLGIAGVAIHSFPPQCLSRFNFSFLKFWWRAMGFFSSSDETYLISFKEWTNSVTNGLGCDQQKQSYYAYAVPESKRIIRNSFGRMAKINFRNAHAPLLFISGSQDQIIPSAINYNNYLKYKKANSITGYRDMTGRNHLVFDETAWKDYAELILYWLKEILTVENT